VQVLVGGTRLLQKRGIRGYNEVDPAEGKPGPGQVKVDGGQISERSSGS
jgi:hypothetical protein